jgi:hypothetical protein
MAELVKGYTIHSKTCPIHVSCLIYHLLTYKNWFVFSVIWLGLVMITSARLHISFQINPIISTICHRSNHLCSWLTGIHTAFSFIIMDFGKKTCIFSCYQITVFHGWLFTSLVISQMSWSSQAMFKQMLSQHKCNWQTDRSDTLKPCIWSQHVNLVCWQS